MKIINSRMSLLLLALTLLVGVSACRKDDPQTDTESAFRVLASDHSFTAEGGQGTVTLSEEGFSAKSDAEWLQLGATADTKLTFTVAPSSQTSTRTANLLITKGEQTEHIAVTQLGAYAYITDLKPSYSLPRQGGEIQIPVTGDLSKLGANVADLPDWIAFRTESDKVILTVSPMTGTGREATVTLSLGSLYVQSIKIQQVYGALGIDHLVGSYTLSGIPQYGRDKVDIDVELAKSTDGKRLILKGLSADLPLDYNPEQNTLTLTYGLLAKSGPGVGENQFVIVAAWGANYPGEDGKGNLNVYAQGSCVGSWDTASIEHPTFAFRSIGNLASIHGIFIYLSNKADGTHFAGAYQPEGKLCAIADFSLTKK